MAKSKDCSFCPPPRILTRGGFSVSALHAFFAVAFFAAFFCVSSVLADIIITPETDLSAAWTVSNTNGITLDGNDLSYANHTGALTINSDLKITLSNGATFEQSGAITTNGKAIGVTGAGTFVYPKRRDNPYGFYFWGGNSVIDTTENANSNSNVGLALLGSLCLYFAGDGELIVGRNIWMNANGAKVQVDSGVNAKISETTASVRFPYFNLTKKTFYFEVAGNLDMSARIVDESTDGSLTKTGAGTMTLTSSKNSYSKPSVISAGKLVLSGAGNLTDTSGVSIAEGATFEFKDNDADGEGGAVTFDRTISGAGNLVKSGTGTVELTAANSTFTGTTTISGGTLILINDALENAHGVFSVGENGTLEFYVAEGTKELSLSAQNELFITGKVIKTGEGELKIDAADPGSIDAQSFVISSGRVDIKTYFDGQLEVKSGATFSPGNSIGPLTIDSQGVVVIGESTYGDGFILNEEGSKLLMEIGGSDVTDNDVLIVQNGNILLGDGIIELVMTDDCTLGLGESFTAVLSAENSDGLDVLGHIQTSDFTDLKYELISDATYGNVYAITGRRFNANEIPEPSTWALLLLGAAGLLYVRKRTRQ